MHLSFSQFKQYKTCPHQWYLAYVKRLKRSEHTIHTTFGQAVHTTVQDALISKKYDSESF